MFTGIIEQLAEVVALKKEGGNLHISLKSTITSELKIDQSIAHNGVCLTVVGIDGDNYTVTAIKETLEKSNLGTPPQESHNDPVYDRFPEINPFLMIFMGTSRA